MNEAKAMDEAKAAAERNLRKIFPEATDEQHEKAAQFVMDVAEGTAQLLLELIYGRFPQGS